jgi:TPR repeat protein
MEWKPIKEIEAKALASGQIDLAIAGYIADAAAGDVVALFNLGVAYSTGSGGVECDLIEAHKWFNLAASRGHEEAAYCRADVSDEMTAREIAEAQRRARHWLAEERRAA